MISSTRTKQPRKAHTSTTVALMSMEMLKRGFLVVGEKAFEDLTEVLHLPILFLTKIKSRWTNKGPRTGALCHLNTPSYQRTYMALLMISSLPGRAPTL